MELEKEIEPRVLDLNELLSRYPAIHRLEEADNSAILDFFDRSRMTGKSLKLRYERSPDFFKFLRYRAGLNHVFGGKLRSGALSGVAAYSFRPGWICGKPETVCYLGDLRAEFNRETAGTWRDFYGDILKKAREIEALSGCRYFYTAIIDDNAAAKQTLVDRPKNPFVYRKLAGYHMINIAGPKPWARRPSNTSVRRATAGDFERIARFLERESSKLPFGYVYSSELERRLNTWDGFGLDSFVLHENKNGEIEGCLAPWSPSGAKRIVVEKMPASLRAFRLLMRPFSMRVPGAGEELTISYLTHFHVQSDLPREKRLEIARRLIRSIYAHRLNGKASLLGLCDFNDDSFLPALSSFFYQKIPMTLYQVLNKAEEDRLGIGSIPSAGFEMALV